ncbi:MAG: malate dehydrogenase (quinone) [Pseudomonadales bacterium]|uniref:Probable malate:quinone oxidoreductase n=1 Tax=Oleiphilus messinensis TaxID=141451 RepID=A0A1Y0IBD3_9GAMM|nr:malate dehydrogenase (quinone) [Oleiphilus messinensis]ARU56703.1 malate:quinone oxidoreductase [Oleiphilus messinensis]MCG8611644.1 malate dehydrogenase (quinone) [Pseudomonadales bacterium]
MIAITADVLLVGAGVMSTTLGMMLKQLDPTLKICMVERLDHVAHESTDGWNNAGTGHAAYCELNYTPETPDGSIDVSRALAINSSFEVTLQFWSYLVENGVLPEPSQFINRAPHKSFVWGEKDVEFLRKRYDAMVSQPSFADMEYSEDPEVLREWMPLVMQNRNPTERVAATKVEYGSDVDFGSLTRSMVKNLESHENFELLLQHSVVDLKQQRKGNWDVVVRNERSGRNFSINAGFVFLGAGGGALPLLQKSGIPESVGYGGFPVSGQWLVCTKQEIVEQHHAKVYGKAPLGAPPMSVPHLDTRIINGKPALLFGPYAGFTTKFLKKGSVFDLPTSVKSRNLKPIVNAGWGNMDLTRYLIKEVFQSHKSRVDALRNFFPEANEKDWELAAAGQRVQIIKECNELGGKLEFGTEVISSKDGTLSALLGASPGASTAVQTMINVIEDSFGARLSDASWLNKMKEMIPSYGQSLTDNPDLLKKVRTRSLTTLQLQA